MLTVLFPSVSSQNSLKSSNKQESLLFCQYEVNHQRESQPAQSECVVYFTDLAFFVLFAKLLIFFRSLIVHSVVFSFIAFWPIFHVSIDPKNIHQRVDAQAKRLIPLRNRTNKKQQVAPQPNGTQRSIEHFCIE